MRATQMATQRTKRRRLDALHRHDLNGAPSTAMLERLLSQRCNSAGHRRSATPCLIPRLPSAARRLSRHPRSLGRDAKPASGPMGGQLRRPRRQGPKALVAKCTSASAARLAAIWVALRLPPARCHASLLPCRAARDNDIIIASVAELHFLQIAHTARCAAGKKAADRARSHIQPATTKHPQEQSITSPSA